MIDYPKSAKGLPLPDLGDFQLALSIAQAGFNALSNQVTGPATVKAAGAAPWTSLTAPNIFTNVSGKFLIFAQLTISVNDGGNLADADSVSFQLTRNGIAIGPVLWTAASTATGAAGSRGVVALCEVSGFIDNSGTAINASTSYALKILSTNGDTSGVVAPADGQISVLELPF